MGSAVGPEPGSIGRGRLAADDLRDRFPRPPPPRPAPAPLTPSRETFHYVIIILNALIHIVGISGLDVVLRKGNVWPAYLISFNFI